MFFIADAGRDICYADSLQPGDCKAGQLRLFITHCSCKSCDHDPGLKIDHELLPVTVLS